MCAMQCYNYNVFFSRKPDKLLFSLLICLYTVLSLLKEYFVCLLVLHAPLIALSQIIGAHGTDVSIEIRLLSGKTLLQAKTPLVVGRTINQVLADSMAIAASALDYCATQPLLTVYILYLLSSIMPSLATRYQVSLWNVHITIANYYTILACLSFAAKANQSWAHHKSTSY